MRTGPCSTYENDGEDKGTAFLIWSLLAHHGADSLGNTDGTFSDDDEGKKTHTLDQVSALEAQHAPDGGDGEDKRSLEEESDVPERVDTSVIGLVILECQDHHRESGSSEEVEERAEAQRKDELVVLGLRAEDQDNKILQRKQAT